MLSNEDAKEEKIHSQYTDLGPIAPTNSIIPDSLDDERYGDHVANHLIMLSDKGEADQHHSDGAFPMNDHGHLVSGNEHGHLLDANKHDKSVDDQLETNGSKDAYLCEEVGRASTRRLQECSEYILESLPVCVSPHKKSFSENFTEKSFIDECQVGTINSNRTKTAADSTKGNFQIQIIPFYLLLGSQMPAYNDIIPLSYDSLVTVMTCQYCFHYYQSPPPNPFLFFFLFKRI